MRATQAMPLTIQVNNDRFYRKLALSGDIGLAESYIEGDWESAEQQGFIRWLLRNESYLPKQNVVQYLGFCDREVL